MKKRFALLLAALLLFAAVGCGLKTGKVVSKKGDWRMTKDTFFNASTPAPPKRVV